MKFSYFHITCLKVDIYTGKMNISKIFIIKLRNTFRDI